MGTDAAKVIYRLRTATAEWTNALARNRGLGQFRVRGLARVHSVLLWYALARDLARTISLRATAAG